MNGSGLKERATDGGLGDDEARALADRSDLAALLPSAAALRDQGHGDLVTVSRKVFIPLTQLCRDVCHYCTFAQPPRRGAKAYLTRDDVLAIARAGAAAGCDEALFTLGDRPELRYRAAREALTALGCDSHRLLSRGDGEGRAGGDRASAAHQCRRHERGRAAPDACRLGLAGDHARDAVRPARLARRPAFRLARQGAGAPHRHDRGGRPRPHSVHQRHPDRHRRDSRRADRGAAGAARDPSPARSHPGNHRPELPRQARHADGDSARAFAGGSSLDHRGGAVDLRARDVDPGAAQPARRRACAADRGRHQRLGWGVAGDARPRQPGGALARARPPCGRDRARRQDACAAGSLRIPCSCATPRPGSIRRCGLRC